MRDRDAAGLLGVICEVCLSVFLGVVADDLDGVLVCADCAVAAEAVELAGDGACVRRVDLFLDLEWNVTSSLMPTVKRSFFSPAIF